MNVSVKVAPSNEDAGAFIKVSKVNLNKKASWRSRPFYSSPPLLQVLD